VVMGEQHVRDREVVVTMPKLPFTRDQRGPIVLGMTASQSVSSPPLPSKCFFLNVRTSSKKARTLLAQGLVLPTCAGKKIGMHIRASKVQKRSIRPPEVR